MTSQTADAISAKLIAAGYEHTRRVTKQGDSIRMDVQRIDGQAMLSLMGILVPGGTPIPGVSVSWETTSGFVIA